MTRTRAPIGSANRWQDWVNLLLGAWLFISPWALGFSNMGAEGGAHSNAATNAWTD